MDFKEKLIKEADEYIEMLIELEYEYPLMSQVKDAFKAGAEWLMRQPLIERLNPDERERLKMMYSGLGEALSNTHDEGFYDAMEDIEKIFGKELFENM